MPAKKYRVIFKVLCSSCLQAKTEGRIVENCMSCKFLKYRSTTKLKSLCDYVDRQYPDWVWMKVYEWRKDENGPLLRTFKNTHKVFRQDGVGHYIYVTTTTDKPTKEQL